MVNQIGMGGEAMGASMLKDEKTARAAAALAGRCLRFVFGEDEVRQLRQLGKGIRWIGEYEVVVGGCLAQETECISTEKGDIVFCLKGAQELTDKSYMLGIEFHRGDMGTTS